MGAAVRRHRMAGAGSRHGSLPVPRNHPRRDVRERRHEKGTEAGVGLPGAAAAAAAWLLRRRHGQGRGNMASSVPPLRIMRLQPGPLLRPFAAKEG